MPLKLTPNELRALMEIAENVRCLSVIAHVDHGKSTLTDSIIAKAGMMSADRAGNAKIMDTRRDEQERGITIKSTAITMPFEVDKSIVDDLKQPTKGNRFIVNLIDSPGHIDFSSEVTAALRVTDGALVVVDCVEGVCVQTETVLRQALAERIKPVLVINKVDRALLELQLGKETLYQTFARTIESVNAVISTYADSARGDLQVYPDQGTVAFASGLHGWAFTLRQIAEVYSKKFGVSKQKLVTKLWGDNYWDPKAKRWTTENTTELGQPLERAFCQFALDPIYKLFETILKGNDEDTAPMLDKLNIRLSPDQLTLHGKDLLKIVMKAFLPAGDALVEMIVLHLPSPTLAQRYRVETLYEGPMDDEAALGIRDCDPQAPLMLFVSKMVPTSDKGRFYAFGRVFSGTVSSGQKVRILSSTSDHHLGKGQSQFKTIQRAVLMLGRTVEPIDDCPAGNIVGLSGIDQFLLKSGTLTSSETAHGLRTMKFSVSPVVQVAVDVQKPTDLPKLTEGIRRLVKSDPGIEHTTSESGQMVIAGSGELHLEIALNDLETEYARVPLKRSEPNVNYRETVRVESRVTALSKSQNRLNRLWASAQPLSDALVEAIESERIGPLDDPQARTRLLTNVYGWDVNHARKLWAFGPGESGANFLVDRTQSVQLMSEVKQSVVTAFKWTTSEGVLVEEPMRGVRLNILDATIHGTSSMRGTGQFISMARRVVYAASLLAEPTLQEPVFLVEIQCPDTALGGVHSVLSRRRGHVFSEVPRDGTPAYVVKAYLPVAESFGFNEELKGQTKGQAFPQSVFDHWDTMPGSALEPGNKLGDLIQKLRVRKGLRPEVPPLEHFNDRL